MEQLERLEEKINILHDMEMETAQEWDPSEYV